MPQNAPQSLSNDDVYVVSAYIRNMNGLFRAGATLDAKSLSAIKMPNRSIFTEDPRPDVKNRFPKKVAEGGQLGQIRHENQTWT
jgi:hypothetical protein